MDDLKTNDTAEPETLPFFIFHAIYQITLMSYLLIIFTDP